MIWDLKKKRHPDDIPIRAEQRVRHMLQVNSWSNGENCEILLGGFTAMAGYKARNKNQGAYRNDRFFRVENKTSITL